VEVKCRQRKQQKYQLRLIVVLIKMMMLLKNNILISESLFLIKKKLKTLSIERGMSPKGKKLNTQNQVR
jgi:hypothetical protein